jgi:nitrite reductase/ring-hydroxylating ferredoxin subunit
MDRWFPVAGSEDAPPHHVCDARLLGTELAVWRDREGGLNAWENRCPHRGLRLTLGSNLGTELACRYHGWRFAAGSGQCKFIPAHPTEEPRASIRTKSHACREAFGLIWVNLRSAEGEPAIAGFSGADCSTGRSLPFPAPLPALRRFLVEAAAARELDDFTLQASLDTGAARLQLLLLLQPADDAGVRIHSLLLDAPQGPARLPILKRQAHWLAGLRRRMAGWPATQPTASSAANQPAEAG